VAQTIANAEHQVIRNKFTHTLALLFLCTYPEQWPSFFTNIFSLLHSPPSGDTPASVAAPSLNPHISTLFLHILLEISGEVADQTLKSARIFDPARHARDGKVRDEVRSRDAPAVSEAVLSIVAEGDSRLLSLRVGLAMKTFASIIRECKLLPIEDPLADSLAWQPGSTSTLA
jgi:exportin-T